MAKKRSGGPRGVIPPPRCKAILLCDQVLVDALTGHYSAIGIFDVFRLPVFPGPTRPFAVYVQLTSGIGSYAITLEIHDLSDNNLLARASGPVINFPERSAKAHVIILSPPVGLPSPGPYDFVVLANGQEIDRQQFLATSIEGADDEQDEAEDPGEG